MPRSRYPRKGQRLAPATLRELLQSPVPQKYVPGRREAATLLADLDESTWQRFSEEECNELGRAIVRQVARALRSPLPTGDRHVPAIPEGLTLADLDLESRTVNCLVAAGIHERPQDLQAMTIEGLLGLRGFWAKSLVDLLSSLEYVRDHPEARRLPRTRAAISLKHLRAAHRYPRPGHILAPQTLREALLERIPARMVRGTSLRGKRLCDLDERVWNELSVEAIGRLAGLVVARAALAAHHQGIRRRHVPRPPKGTRLEDLHLENRTYNCLVREGYGERPENLGKLTVAEILSIRAFGTKSLVDLLSSLETRIAREGKMHEGLTAEAQALAALPEAARVHFSDPRLGGRLRAMDSESNTVAEMAQRIVRRRLDPPDPGRLADQLRDLRETIVALTRVPLEEELVEIFAPDSRKRDRQIVAEYYGWDGQGGRTLEQLGRKYGLSRERIRQICVRAVKRSRDVPVFAPVLDRALDSLARRTPRPVDSLREELDRSGIASRHVPLDSLLEAARFLGRQVPFSVVEVGRHKLAVAPTQANLPRIVVQAARRAVANYGVATVRQVEDELPGRQAKRIGGRLVRATLETMGDFAWLDKRRNWFRLETSPQYGLPNLIEKVLSVVPAIEVGRLRRALARHRRSRERLPSAKILLEFCRQMPGVGVEDRRVVSQTPRDWREVLSGVERGMVEVLIEHGPAMERSAFEERCVEAGINRFSFNAAVMSSPVIVQHGRSVYGLLGARLDRRRLRELSGRRPGAAPARVLRDYGKHEDGTLYVVYRLSKAAISGGVITVPAAMKRQVRGRFTLRGSQGRKLGTLVAKDGCGWGLGPALRALGARPGDFLRLSFPPGKRHARLELGDESLVQEGRRP